MGILSRMSKSPKSFSFFFVFFPISYPFSTDGLYLSPDFQLRSSYSGSSKETAASSIIIETESLTTVPRSQSHDSFVFEFFQVHFPFCTSQFLSDFLICCLFAILFEPTSWTERPVRTINLKWPAMLILCVDTSLDTQLLAGPVGDWRTKWT